MRDLTYTHSQGPSRHRESLHACAHPSSPAPRGRLFAHTHTPQPRERARAHTPQFSRHPGIRPMALTTLTRIHLKTFIFPFGLVGFFFFSPVLRVAQQARGRGAGLTSLFPLPGTLAHFRLSYFRRPRRHFLSLWCGGGGGGTDPQTHNASLQERRRARGKEGGGKKKNPRPGELWVVKTGHVNTLPYRLLTQRL